MANLLKRVEIVEHKVGPLEELPARVDGLVVEIAQLRTEMRDEFSAIRAEMKAGDEETRTQLRTEMREGFSALEAKMTAADEGTRTLMTALHQEGKRHTLVLYEDLVERIKWIREGTPSALPKDTRTTGARRRVKKPRRSP